MRRKSTCALMMAVVGLSVAKAGPADPQPTTAVGEAVLLDDDFRGLTPGMFSGGEVGAHGEYHYLSALAPKGNWVSACFANGTEAQRCWRVVREDGQSMLAQFYPAGKKRPETHPMVVTANLDTALWRDYRAAVEFAPQAVGGQSGFAFRYHNSRCYYFLGVSGEKAVLKLVKDALAYHKPYEKVLAEEPYRWKAGQWLTVVVEVRGNHLRASIDGGPMLEADEDTFAEGRVALTCDVPTKYRRVRVTTSLEEKARFDAALAQRNAELATLRAAQPKLKLWKKFDIDDYGVGRSVRFGDLDGDGKPDMLFGQVKHHGPKNNNSEVGCLTAVRLDGKVLWQVGQSDRYNNSMLTNDVAFQIHDLDGDGRNEVIYCMNMELVVADGATGKTKYKIPTPDAPTTSKKTYNRFPRVLGDSLYFCDLRGTGRRADVVLKDRYEHVWTFDDRLRPLWQAACNTGHYPFAFDVNGDGKDELLVGYTLFGPDGKVLWSNDKKLNDHADGVAIASFAPGEPPRVLCAASDEGIFFTDLKGQILKHHYLGHVQNPTIANLRDDLPGLEVVTINFWGNQGIMHYYDAQGDVCHDCEPHHQGSMCQPINWSGRSEELILLSANVEEGGLLDGWGRRVAEFPADGHPDLCCAALDLMGDCRDEIVVWDPWEVWIYTQDDNPKPGRLYKPTHNPHCNESNYMANVSLPGWSE